MQGLRGEGGEETRHEEGLGIPGAQRGRWETHYGYAGRRISSLEDRGILKLQKRQIEQRIRPTAGQTFWQKQDNMTRIWNYGNLCISRNSRG